MWSIGRLTVANDESRRDRWKAPGSEVSTFLFEKKKRKVSSLRFQSTSSSLSCSCTRDSHVHVCFTNYTYARSYTHERLYTQSKKKRNTIILYSRSAFCLQFHFNLLFVNLPSSLRKALHTCAQKRYKKRGGERETTSTPLLLICKSMEK